MACASCPNLGEINELINKQLSDNNQRNQVNPQFKIPVPASLTTNVPDPATAEEGEAFFLAQISSRAFTRLNEEQKFEALRNAICFIVASEEREQETDRELFRRLDKINARLDKIDGRLDHLANKLGGVYEDELFPFLVQS